MLSVNKKILVITGHYGSGKTNFAINLAIDLKKAQKEVVLVDLDVVNPYFRSSGYKNRLQQMGISVVASKYANSTLDIPALGAEIHAAFTDSEQTVIFDVGGDDAGAYALGRFSKQIENTGYEMLYVVNRYRYLTQTPDQAVEILSEIQRSSRLIAAGIVNNSNLGKLTTAEDIEKSIPFCEEVAEQSGIPIRAVCAEKSLHPNLPQNDLLYPVSVYVTPPWEVSPIEG